MPVDRRKAAVFAAGAALRLAVFVFLPEVSDLLGSQVEVATPLTSFKRLQEGLFLYKRNVSAYDGGIFHQAPLLLPLFSIIPAVIPIGLASGVLYTIIDLLNAYALGTIANSAESTSTRLYTSPRKDDRLSGDIISAAYLFNPFTVAACLGLSTSIFTNMAIMHAVSSALDRQTFRAMFALALASYLSMYPALLLPPLAILCWDRVVITGAVQKSAYGYTQTLLTTFSATLAALFGASYITTGSWSFVSATYGFHLLVPDLTPNVGLWWYFFIEIFDSFRAFFLGVFWLHLASYVGGLTLRLRKQPLFVVTTLLGLFAILKPYPSISDVSLYLAFLPLYKHIFSLTRYTFVASSVLLYASLLGPAFYYLWIYAGSGNANFFYAITLVWSLGLAMLVGDSLFAVLRDEFEVERPEMKGKDVKRV